MVAVPDLPPPQPHPPDHTLPTAQDSFPLPAANGVPGAALSAAATPSPPQGVPSVASMVVFVSYYQIQDLICCVTATACHDVESTMMMHLEQDVLG